MDLPSLLSGQLYSLASVCFGLGFSIPLNYMAFSMQIRLKAPAVSCFIFIFGLCIGTPLLLQLIFIYYVLPSIGIPAGSDSCSDYCLYIKLCGLFCGDFPWRHFFHSDWTLQRPRVLLLLFRRFAELFAAGRKVCYLINAL